MRFFYAEKCSVPEIASEMFISEKEMIYDDDPHLEREKKNEIGRNRRFDSDVLLENREKST